MLLLIHKYMVFSRSLWVVLIAYDNIGKQLQLTYIEGWQSWINILCLTECIINNSSFRGPLFSLRKNRPKVQASSDVNRISFLISRDENLKFFFLLLMGHYIIPIKIFNEQSLDTWHIWTLCHFSCWIFSVIQPFLVCTQCT